MSVNRRDFLKGAAAVGIAGASIGAVNTAAAETQEINGVKVPYTTYEELLHTENWLGEKPQIDDTDIAETIQTDVLVIGAGHSGIQCALAAAEGGVKVDVVEKMPEDMRKVKGEDIGHINSQWLIDQGCGPYNVGEVVTEFCLRSGGRVNPEIIRKYLANSGEMFDHTAALVKWPDDRIKAVQDIGEEFSPLDPSQCIVHLPGAALSGPVEYPIVLGGFKSWAGTAQFMGTIRHDDSGAGGIAAFSRLDEFQQFAILQSKDLGAVWHFEESGVVLVQNDAGDVVGAITQKADGSYVKYETSLGVVLCTGGFASNPDMVVNLCPEAVEWCLYSGGDPSTAFGLDENGQGHKMACWAGGRMEPYTRATLGIGSGAGGPWGLTPMLWLAADGKRFMNEASIQMDLPFQRIRAHGRAFSITDKNYAKNILAAGLDHWAPNFGREDYWTELCEDVDAVPVDDPAGAPCRNMYIAERDPKMVWAASTIEGLLGMLGFEGEALETALASIEHYNEMCAAGVDEDYGKEACQMIPVLEPPFYGAYVDISDGSSIMAAVTVAGVMTDDDLRVIDANKNVIKGLYVAGNVLGQRYGLGYVAPFAGNSIGMAMTHGRVAGKLITGQEVL